MCGITGLYAFNELGRFFSINIQKSVQTLEKRGPDASRLFNTERAFLGHTRLSIIDLSTAANQPMRTEDGRYTIVFNGEIYNYQSLREELKAKYSFSTESDTEVLLYAYVAYKEKCLDKLNGFFAFAVYDQQENELFIARDRMGIKPLYYYLDEDKFAFASEMRAISAYGFGN